MFPSLPPRRKKPSFWCRAPSRASGHRGSPRKKDQALLPGTNPQAVQHILPAATSAGFWQHMQGGPGSTCREAQEARARRQGPILPSVEHSIPWFPLTAINCSFSFFCVVSNHSIRVYIRLDYAGELNSGNIHLLLALTAHLSNAPQNIM